MSTTLAKQEEASDSSTYFRSEDGSTVISALPTFQQPLHAYFNGCNMQRWESACFRKQRPIQSAPRNKGQVDHMLDVLTSTHVAVKSMPNDWVTECHELFLEAHPGETEHPWVDIGCMSFLTGIGYPYVCPLVGVFQDEFATRVVTELAWGGDLFDWCGACGELPGLSRERLVQPLFCQIADAVRHLHELSIVHRDISSENILLTHRAGKLHIQLIDFAMATEERFIRGGGHGKPAYQAPESHMDNSFDGFVSDTFAVGVVLYLMLMGDYPWSSTDPQTCTAFGFCHRHGFKAFVAKRKSTKNRQTIARCTSNGVMWLLEGLLSISPVDRLTLGESTLPRSHVWEEPWMHCNGATVK